MKLLWRDLRPTSLIAGVAIVMSAGTVSAGSILNSAHDQSSATWNTEGEICIICHTPHNGDVNQDAPLWNHDVTTATHTMYSSGSLDGAIDPTPTGHSLLCLSCHDGTVALDSYGGKAGATYIPPNRSVGTDLSNDHPISITYDDTTAGADGALYPPSSTTGIIIGTGADSKEGTLAEMMVPTGKVQCTSCHDVHNKFVQVAPLLKISNAGSALCLTCHNK